MSNFPDILELRNSENKSQPCLYMSSRDPKTHIFLIDITWDLLQAKISAYWELLILNKTYFEAYYKVNQIHIILDKHISASLFFSSQKIRN
jgi:hypothetical protein